MVEVVFTESVIKHGECLVILIGPKLSLSNNITGIEEIAGVSINSVIKTQGFEGKYGDVLIIPTASEKIKKIVLFGIGDSKSLNLLSSQKLGGKLYVVLSGQNVEKAKLNFSIDSAEAQHIMFNMMLGLLIRSYKFDKYFTKKNEEERKVELAQIEVVWKDPHTTGLEFEKIKAIYNGIELTKNLVLEPPNILSPVVFSEICKELSTIGVKVEVLDENRMAELNMNALLGVAQGSSAKPRLVTMMWQGENASSKPLAFVGKGVTFDTGGLSLKPATGMVGMKYDMAGAAAVTGLIKALALRKAKVNVVGVIGLVENMPDGNAQRPEDVVRSMSGQTIEILNTDAEGRLVLADALWYTQDKFSPELMVDMATLTGAIRICLAEEYAGLFSNNKDLANKLYESGIKSGEKVWELPLNKEYDKMVNSKIADVQNIGSEAGGGSITAAQFLQRFVNNTTWAHLDIAAMAMTKQNTDLHRAGATAFGVRLLNQFIADYYEK